MVEVRCLDHGVAVAAELAVALVVGQDEDDVGLVGHEKPLTQRTQRGLTAATEVVSVQGSVVRKTGNVLLHNTFRGIRLGNTNKIKDLEP